MIGLQKKQRWQHTSFCSWDPGFVITSLFGNNRTFYISLIYFLIKNRILYKLYILGYFSNHCMWRNSEPTQGLMSHFQPMTETIVETLAGLVVRQVLHHPPYLLAILPALYSSSLILLVFLLPDANLHLDDFFLGEVHSNRYDLTIILQHTLFHR